MKRNVLVTAGPTWVKLDSFRILTNISTGRTGVVIADEFFKQGFGVTLLQGPAADFALSGKLRVRKFRYFQELKSLLQQELSRNRYLAVIHAAAVSDYLPLRTYKGKIKSQKSRFLLKLKPAPKLLRLIRSLARQSLLIQFKLECGVSVPRLIKMAQRSLQENGADFAVANRQEDVGPAKYCGYIVSCRGEVIKAAGRRQLGKQLCRIVREQKA